MNFPADLRYTKDHEWLRVEGDTALVGITEFAQHELGDIVYVDISTVGKTISQHEVFGTVEAVKTVSDLFMPLSGEIITTNPLLENEPDLVNREPYGNGWMVKIRFTDASELDSLLTAEAYQAEVG